MCYSSRRFYDDGISLGRARAPEVPGWSKCGPLDPVPYAKQGLSRGRGLKVGVVSVPFRGGIGNGFIFKSGSRSEPRSLLDSRSSCCSRTVGTDEGRDLPRRLKTRSGMRADGRRGRRPQCGPETRTVSSRSVRLCVRPHEAESQGVEGGENKRIPITDRIRKPFAKMANGMYI